MQTLPNGIEIFTNGDNYNLAEDLATAFKTAGVIVSVTSETQRDALPAALPGVNVTVRRLDLGGDLQWWDGTTWKGTPYREWTTAASGLAANTVYNLGAYSVVDTTTDTTFVNNSGGSFNFSRAGSYTVMMTQKFSAAVTGRAFLSLEDTPGATTGRIYARTSYQAGEDTATLNATFRLKEPETLYPKVYHTNSGTLGLSGHVHILRAGS